MKVTPTKINIINYTALPQEIQDLIDIKSNDVMQRMYNECDLTVEAYRKFYDECKSEGETFEEFVKEDEVGWWLAQNVEFSHPEYPLWLDVCW